MKQRISIFGAGRVGQALYDLFKNLKYPVKISSSRPGFSYDFTKASIEKDDLVFITCPTVVIANLSSDLSSTGASLVHCSGADSLDLLDSERRGVFYPLQTFSGQKLDWGKIPIFIQGDDKTTQKLTELAKSSNLRYSISSDTERSNLHLAAVFANNFTNAIYHASQQLVGKESFDHLLPLIQETVKNVQRGNPGEVQTGPAVRGDQSTINRHVEMLSDRPREREIYLILTKYIQNLA